MLYKPMFLLSQPPIKIRQKTVCVPWCGFPITTTRQWPRGFDQRGDNASWQIFLNTLMRQRVSSTVSERVKHTLKEFRWGMRHLTLILQLRNDASFTISTIYYLLDCLLISRFSTCIQILIHRHNIWRRTLWQECKRDNSYGLDTFAQRERER